MNKRLYSFDKCFQQIQGTGKFDGGCFSAEHAYQRRENTGTRKQVKINALLFKM